MAHSGHSEFTSLVTHQLREPLTNIKWILSLLINDEVGKLSPEQKDLSEKAFGSSERALKLIDDMLKADRIDSDSFDFFPVESDIVDLTQKVVEEMKPQASLKKIDIVFHADHKNTPLVSIDPEHIHDVFLNLIENAIHYTKESGKISVTIKLDNKEIIISVSDTGIGIPKEEALKIFGRFFRAHNAQKANNKGSGLGLFIVKSIVLRHKGRVWFTSKENEGSTFFVALPLKGEN